MALLTKSQIEGNLRRTASKGQMSLLTLKEINALSKKYFGIIEDGKLAGYYCPYSGLEIRSKDDLVLEHIIPVSSGGGTVLFNCIPSHKIVNGIDQKGANHLLTWWETSEYFDINRLENIVNYMFDAYDKVFEKHEINEVLTSFQSYEETNLLESDLSTTSEEIQEKLNEQSQKTGFIKYRQFLADCISTLEKNGIDVTKYREKLNELSNKGIFKEIDNYELIQESLRKIFKEKLDEVSRRELTVLLNYDIIPLIDSLKEYNSEEEIYNELSKRIDNLEKILEQNNIGIISYLEDIRNCPNLLAKKIEDITNEDINTLVVEINLSVNDKFNKLIKWYQNNPNKERPSKGKNGTQEENKLVNFYETIKRSQRKKDESFTMNTSLNKQQLEYLAKSDDERLRKLYQDIYYNALEKNFRIAYEDNNMRKYLLELIAKKRHLDSIEDYNEYVSTMIDLYEHYGEILKRKDKIFCYLIEWYQNNPNKERPSEGKNGTQEEKDAAILFNNLKRTALLKNNNYIMVVSLNKQQLEYLAKSDDERLRKLYKDIYYKALENNIIIAYEDETIRPHLLEIIQKKENLNSIENFDNYVSALLELSNESEDALSKTESKFCEIIVWYQNNKELSIQNGSKNIEEQQLYDFIKGLKKRQRLKNGCYSFERILNKQQLEYLAKSDDERLRKLYKDIYYKALENNIIIAYEDETIRPHLLEIIQKKENLNSIENAEEYVTMLLRIAQESDEILEQKNMNFCNLIKWHQNNKNEKQPTRKNILQEEKGIISFFYEIKQTRKTEKGYTMFTSLNKQQLEYLAKSDDERLRKLYKDIYYEALEKNVTIAYEDETIRPHLLEIIEKKENLNSIENAEEYVTMLLKIAQESDELLEQKDITYCQLIKWFQINKNKRKPYDESTAPADEQMLRHFMDSIQSVSKLKKGNTMSTSLNKQQLEYLAKSDDERLRKLYKNIYYKSLENNVTIAYEDETIRPHLLEIIEKKENLDSIKNAEEYVALLLRIAQESDEILEQKDMNFCNLLMWYRNNLNKKTRNPRSEDLEEKRIGRFASSVKRIRKIKNGNKSLNTSLNKQQLEYLATSEDSRLNNLYDGILSTAEKNNIPIAYYPPEYERQAETYGFIEEKEIENEEETQVKKGR